MLQLSLHRVGSSRLFALRGDPFGRSVEGAVVGRGGGGAGGTPFNSREEGIAEINSCAPSVAAALTDAVLGSCGGTHSSISWDGGRPAVPPGAGAIVWSGGEERPT